MAATLHDRKENIEAPSDIEQRIYEHRALVEVSRRLYRR